MIAGALVLLVGLAVGLVLGAVLGWVTHAATDEDELE